MHTLSRLSIKPESFIFWCLHKICIKIVAKQNLFQITHYDEFKFFTCYEKKNKKNCIDKSFKRSQIIPIPS